MDTLAETNIFSDHIYASLHYDIEPAINKTTGDEVNVTCRICLQTNAFKDWDEEIVEFCGISFKDFYYKFTQLEILDDDPYPKMLCQTCLTDLKAAHLLTIKTLESYKVLRGTHLEDSKTICNGNNTDYIIKCIPRSLNRLIKQNEELVKAIANLHTTLKETFIEPKSTKEINCNTSTVNLTESIKNTKPTPLHENIDTKPKKRKFLIKDDSNYQEIDAISKGEIYEIELTEPELQYEEIGIDHNISVVNLTECNKNINSSHFQEDINSKSNKTEVFTDNDSDNQETNTILESEICKIELTESELNEGNPLNHTENEKVIDFEDYNSDKEDTNDLNTNNKETSVVIKEIVTDNKAYTNIKTKKKRSKKIKVASGSMEKFFCSYCPKQLCNKKSVERHEATHDESRERKETCPECGTKFYTLNDMRGHLRTHSSQREKKHKCEFCDKAYYDRGYLNVHRRIHLGQMISCTICSKEFYRQQDLNLHQVKAHSVTPIHGKINLKQKYYVHCNECNKTMRTTSWKEHQANHLKIPLLQCSLCNIDFFSRCACKWHMAKVHDYKKRDEYEPHIVYLKDKRLSPLLLQQKKLLLETPDTPET